MININLAAGFISTAFVVLKAIVVAWDFYKDFKLKKEALNPRKNWRKKRLARNNPRANNISVQTNSDTLGTHADFSPNIIDLDTMTVMNMDQISDLSFQNQTSEMSSKSQTKNMSLNQTNEMSSRNQSFVDINPPPIYQSPYRNRYNKNNSNLISYSKIF